MATQTVITSIVDLPANVVSLSAANETVLDKSQDIRGRDVISKDGKKIGEVDTLYVDAADNKVRYMRVETGGGFLHINDTKFMLPIDAITSVTSDKVHVGQTGEKIADAPVYDPTIVSRDSFFYPPYAYDYYGYRPYWADGYVYPRWW